MSLEIGDRREALLHCFQKLDKDQSGYIEFWELRALAKQITPKQNLDDAQDLLKYLDRDHDRRVSFAEFLELMVPLTEPMDDMEFAVHARAILQGEHPDEALNEPGYKHRQDCRAYLVEEVVPQLRQGLLELVTAVEKHRIQLAAGAQWDSDGYLPHHWAPFSPLRWLGTWMLERSTNGPYGNNSSNPKHGAVEEWLSTNINPMRTFAELSRHDKVALAFRHLDRDCSGCLDASELLAMSGRLHKDQDIVYAQKLLHSMDTNENGKVDFAEYCHFILQLTEMLTDSEFEAAIHKLLGATHLSYCLTRGDKLRFLFHELDKESAGMISVDEVEAIARRLDPDATPWKIQSALDFDRQDPSHVDINEFVFIMEGLVSHIKDGAVLDELIAMLVEGQKVGAYIAPADPTEEVEPQELKELVKSLPVAQHTLQIGSIEVMDAVTGNSESPMLLVDVRSEEEVLVSTIPGAIHCPAEKDDSLPHGWSADMDKLKKHLALLAVLPGGAATAAAVDAARSGTEAGVAESKPMRIVAFCNTGERSGASSIMMTEKVGLPVGIGGALKEQTNKEWLEKNSRNEEG
uniref:Calmodulin n=1 Tax=Dunaliella tertiolecta TaxID=3047 RepID=A0A7S3VP16_DUNTE